MTSASPRPGLRDATAALRHRNFALFWGAALVSNTGTWIQGVSIPFVLFRLTDSAAWVGLGTFAQFFPAVVLGPLAGSIADRYPRRRILLVTQVGLGIGALGLWAVWTSGVRSPGLILAMVTGIGVIAGLNIPSWQAFVTELVPRETLLNAITLNSAQFNASRAFGPALGGVVLAAWGPGWAFLVNAISYGTVIGALLLIRVPVIALRVLERPRIMREFGDTLRYVRRRPGIMACITTVTFVGLLGSPVFSLTVVFAEEVFHVGRGLYGLLGAALGFGAVLAAPLVAGPGSGRARGPLTAVAVIAYGGAIALFGFAPGYWLGFVALLVAGGCYLAFASTMNTTIQLQVGETMRGRAVAVYLMALTAAVPIGSLVQGWFVQWIGPRWTVGSAGAALCAIGIYLRQQGGYARMDDEAPDEEIAAAS